ncbi:MAG: type VI secretion system lipoprotein TssJ [Candidatus Zixiibacteriota bacterium]
MSRSTAYRMAALVIVVEGLAGCGILFSKQEKPMRVEVAFTGTDSLNFDGQTAQAVQVKAFILNNTERFSATNVQAFFSSTFDVSFTAEFAKDIIDSVTLIIAPRETRRSTIEIPFSRARNVSPHFGAIANFAQPATVRGRERIVFKIPKKTQQTVAIQLGSNWVERGK